MADTKVSALTALGAAPATTDLVPIVDVSDTTMAASGTNKKLTVAELFTSPTFTTPTIGVATATSVNKVAITAPASSATLTIANGKTLTANNSLTLAGTDSTTMTFPSTTATIARTDAGQTFSGSNTFGSVLGGGINSALYGFGVTHQAYTSDQTLLTNTIMGRLVTNTGATGEVILTLPAGVVGAIYYFDVTAAQYLRIKAPASNTIVFNTTSTATAGYIRSNTVGNMVLVLGIATNVWHAFSIGTATGWTVDS